MAVGDLGGDGFLEPWQNNFQLIEACVYIYHGDAAHPEGVFFGVCFLVVAKNFKLIEAPSGWGRKSHCILQLTI